MSKFCGNCGANLEDDANVCGYCGVPCENKKVTVPNFSGTVGTKKSGKGKKLVIAAVAVIAVVVLMFSLSSKSKEPCDWCGHSPSVKYKVSDGYAYVCKDCSSRCMFCGDKAKKHYENFAGTVVFVCNDCYKDISSN